METRRTPAGKGGPGNHGDPEDTRGDASRSNIRSDFAVQPVHCGAPKTGKSETFLGALQWSGTHRVMDVNHSTGRSAMPQLVVKIVGGKQIKHFIDPNRMETGGQNAGQLCRSGDGKTSCPALANPSNNTHFASNKNILRQAQHRLCVSAPSGDHSCSYIHRRRPAGNHLKPTQPTPHQSGQEQQRLFQGVHDVHVEDWLIAQASKELRGWTPQLDNIDEEVAPLDPSHTGTIHQSELKYLFRRRQVPLKLPTLASLLHTFSCSEHPEQVLYEDLLHFLQNLLQNQESGNTAADIWTASCESRTSIGSRSMCSSGAIPNVDPSETDAWLQRFQKMERALRICDSQNTGYIDMERARRLIQNYSVIFNLRLSPVRVNEVIREAELGGRVHLATALLLLKDR